MTQNLCISVAWGTSTEVLYPYYASTNNFTVDLSTFALTVIAESANISQWDKDELKEALKGHGPL